MDKCKYTKTKLIVLLHRLLVVLLNRYIIDYKMMKTFFKFDKTMIIILENMIEMAV